MKYILTRTVFLASLCLPLLSSAQQNLTGIWRLKNYKLHKGPDYTNAIPTLFKITQQVGSMEMELSIANGKGDTIINEIFIYQQPKEDITPSGKKRVTELGWDAQQFGWLKTSIIYLKVDPNKQESIDKHVLRLDDPNTLVISRVYNGNDDPKGNQDFSVTGRYERITEEQLERESAKGKGINFIEGMTWTEIKAKAKKENKQIFVDVYATWCRPCKIMDRDVYPLNMVGDVMNDRFISIKVQVDSTKADPLFVKMLFPAAREFEQKYSVSGLPSYLFFNPDGEVFHKAMGQQSPKDFIQLINDLNNPEKQLYTLYNKAKNKQIPYNEFPALAKLLKENYNEKQLATEVIRIYKKGYLDKLKDAEYFEKGNLDLLAAYWNLISSKDRLFKTAFHNPNKIDSIRYPGWSARIVKAIIIAENVQPLFGASAKTGKEPDWNKLQNSLTKVYGKQLAITYTLDARVDWYQMQKKWDAYLTWLPKHFERYDLNKYDPISEINTAVWKVYLYSDDKKLMEQAIGWMDIALANWKGVMMDWDGPTDTKARLLYKLGKRQEAIQLQEKLVNAFPHFAYVYQPVLDKMKRGEEIWLEENR